MRRLFVCGLAIFAAAGAWAGGLSVGDLMIKQPFAYETPTRAKTAAGYLQITNTGDTDDVLTGVSDGPSPAMLHRTETDANGVTRMLHQSEGIPIPAGETVIFEPGGLHVMFMGIAAPFKPQDTHTYTLVFRDAGPVEVPFVVEARAGAHGGHGGHSDHAGHGDHGDHAGHGDHGDHGGHDDHEGHGGHGNHDSGS
ncbi:MAG: copper chaperone PCu(A)C [Pseudomonadota bacterium]